MILEQILNERVLNDEGIEQLLLEKSKLLNNMNVKYIFNVKDLIFEAIPDKRVCEKLEKIDSLLAFEVEKIKKNIELQYRHEPLGFPKSIFH
tara:strand:+ start:259 stop:534 length:276 start_codon:yes stop_codon:yes gene_type:complete